MRKGKHCSLKVRSVYLLVILKMSKVTNFFNHIVMKLLLEEMLNLMKISWPVSLIWRLCLLSAYEPSSTFVPSSVPILVSYLDDDSEDENPPSHALLPPDDSIEPEPTPTPPLPSWVHSTREEAGDLVGDPSDQCRKCSQFQPSLFFFGSSFRDS
jgi:hypothetical protein